MTSSDEEYLIKRRKQIERRQKIFTFVSVAGFVGSMVFSAIPAIQQARENYQRGSSQAAVLSTEALLQQQAKNYELVLQREPNNQMALERLSLLRLQMKDFQGSIELVEKLAKLHPDRQDYKIILQQARKQQGQKTQSDR